MISEEVSRAVLDLPVEDRLELVRRLVESVVRPATVNEAVAEGIRRTEAVAKGKVTGLNEEQFRVRLGHRGQRRRCFG